MVCLESMNQLEVRPDLRVKSPRLDRVRQQVFEHPVARRGVVAHVRTHLTGAGTRVTHDGRHDAGAGGGVNGVVDVVGVDRNDHAESAVEDAHHLVRADPATTLDLVEDLGGLEGVHVDNGVTGWRAGSAPRCP